MTPSELIPVLRALHTNPTTAPVFADWFEERGEEQIAAYLRTEAAQRMGRVKALVWQFTAGGSHHHPMIANVILQDWLEKTRYHPIGDAVYVAQRRADQDFRDDTLRTTGVSPTDWVMMEVNKGWADRMSIRIPLYEQRGLSGLFDSIEMIRYEVRYLHNEPEPLCGGEASIGFYYWRGTDPVTSTVYVSRSPEPHFWFYMSRSNRVHESRY